MKLLTVTTRRWAAPGGYREKFHTSYPAIWVPGIDRELFHGCYPVQPTAGLQAVKLLTVTTRLWAALLAAMSKVRQRSAITC